MKQWYEELFENYAAKKLTAEHFEMLVIAGLGTFVALVSFRWKIRTPAKPRPTIDYSKRFGSQRLTFKE